MNFRLESAGGVSFPSASKSRSEIQNSQRRLPVDPQCLYPNLVVVMVKMAVVVNIVCEACETECAVVSDCQYYRPSRSRGRLTHFLL